MESNSGNGKKTGSGQHQFRKQGSTPYVSTTGQESSLYPVGGPGRKADSSQEIKGLFIDNSGTGNIYRPDHAVLDSPGGFAVD
jgi:hypothetical protein